MGSGFWSLCGQFGLQTLNRGMPEAGNRTAGTENRTPKNQNTGRQKQRIGRQTEKTENITRFLQPFSRGRHGVKPTLVKLNPNPQP